MNIQQMTDDELYRLGIELLANRLGPKGVNRFLNICEPISYDYSVKRHEWIDEFSDIGSIMEKIQQNRVVANTKNAHIIQNETSFIKDPESIAENNMTDTELHKVALRILVEELSIAGMPRFIRICNQKTCTLAIETDRLSVADNKDIKEVVQ